MIRIYIEELWPMLELIRPKIVFCDSDTIDEVRKALRTLSLDTSTKLITVDCQGDQAIDSVEDLLQPYADENEFMY